MSTNPFPKGSIAAIQFNKWQGYGVEAAKQLVQSYLNSGLSDSMSTAEWSELAAAQEVIHQAAA